MDPIVVASLIAAVPALITAWNGRKTRRRVEAVHAEVRTNDGLRAGEYLEKIQSIDKAVHENKDRLNQFYVTLSDHTVADAVNFQELADNMQQLVDMLTTPPKGKGTPRAKP